jgi:manganese transport protein
LPCEIWFAPQGNCFNFAALSRVAVSLRPVFPLVMFTGDKLKMGEFVNPLWRKILAYAVAVVIAALNAWLLTQIFSEWFMT